MYKKAERETERRRDGEKERWREREMERKRDGQTQRPEDMETEGQRDKEIERQINTGRLKERINYLK
jgi:hypothetical protein